jgi:endoglucanase
LTVKSEKNLLSSLISFSFVQFVSLYLVPMLAALLFGLMGSNARAQSNSDELFEETFDNPSSLSSRWSGAMTTVTNGPGYALSMTNAHTTDSIYHFATLTPSLIAGRRIILSAQASGSGLSTPPSVYNGIKVMLCYTDSSGNSQNPQIVFPSGTFGWMTGQVAIDVPAGITSVSLCVGLELASGTALVDNVRIQGDPTEFLETFDNSSAISARWSGAPYSVISHGSGSAISMTTSGSSYYLTTPLSAAAISGHRIILMAEVKGTGISTPPASYNGVKVMLSYTDSTGNTQNPQIPFGGGTFNWTHGYCVINVPQNIVSATLVLGIESVSGAVAFDNVKVVENPLVISDNFDDAGVSSRWSGSGSSYTIVANGTGSALQMTNSNSSGGIYSFAPVSSLIMAGKPMVMQCDIKASGISTPPGPSNGIKACIFLNNAGGSAYYYQIQVPAGTYDWTKFSTIINVPADVTSGSLCLSLELSTGTVQFDNLRFFVKDTTSPYWVNPTPNYKGHNVAYLRGAMVGTQVGPSDIDALHSWHANVIRWQLGPQYGNGLDTANFSTALAGETSLLDANLSELATDGMLVTLDLHTLSAHEFNGRTEQDLLISTWQGLVTHYLGNSTIWSYDIANEPDDTLWNDSLLDWNELAQQVAWNIRELDPTKAIVIESIGGNPQAFAQLRPADTNNVVYSLHMYHPNVYTFQNLGSVTESPMSYPGTFDGTYWNSSQMLVDLAPATAFQAQYQTSIYVGEFSALRWAPGGANYLGDLVNNFDNLGWDWTYHAFREWEGWDVEMEDDTTNPDAAPITATSPTDRESVLRSAYSTNTLPAN